MYPFWHKIMKERLLLKTLSHHCCHCQRSEVLLNSNGKTKRKKKKLLSKKSFFSSRCETEFTSSNMMEIAIVEASRRYWWLAICFFSQANFIHSFFLNSGQLKERTVHTVEDCLKLLECGVSLKKEAVLNKNSSIATFKKLKVFAIQMILSVLFMNDQKSWWFIEKQTATLPSSWNDRILFVQYLEIVGTLLVC